MDTPAVPTCLDCGAPVTGAYCAACGQKYGPPVQPLRELVSEAVADTFSLDGRLYRTLRLLLFRPGQLTIEYLAGRRTRYTPPLRLYLSISVLYFGIFFATGHGRFFFIYAGGGNDPEFDAFVRRLPQLMFLLVPVFALLVRALTRARRLYEEHLVFALHYHAFSFLILPIDSALQSYSGPRIGAGDFTPLAVAVGMLAGAVELWIIIYLGLALRRVYGGWRITAALRAFLVLTLYCALLIGIAVATVPTLRAYVWQSLTGA